MGTSQSKSLAIAYAFATTTCVLVDEASARPFLPSSLPSSSFSFLPRNKFTRSSELDILLSTRGGDDGVESEVVAPPPPPPPPPAAAASSENHTEDEPSLDEKVHAAMRKLGLSPPSDAGEVVDDGENNNCKDGICTMPQEEQQQSTVNEQKPAEDVDPFKLADALAEEFNVDKSLAMAAIGATSTFGEANQRIFNPQAARDMIQQELDLIASIPEDSENVQQLISEGFDVFLCRRALAFTENDIDNARAILIADQMDEEEEAAAAEAEVEEAEQAEASTATAEEEEDEEAAIRAQLRAEMASKKPDMVEVKSNFDPTAPLQTNSAAAAPPPQQQPPNNNFPKPAAKESVVFEATTEQVQELVMESPVPVLLDIHAEWCGPCKALGPALEEMAVKAGGIFRLVKVDSDNERPISQALEITSLPTVLGIRDGKIVHMFKGMPRSEDFMKNFMLGLFGAGDFQPPVTADEKEKYEELTSKLLKTAGAANFSFASRERLHERITTKLDELVNDDAVANVEDSASLLRTLLSNIIKKPYEAKYRKINLENKVISAKISKHASCLAILKSVGFRKSNQEMIFGQDKKVVNVAPFVCARDCIDKWVQKNRNEMAAAARKRKDELDRARLQAEAEARGDDEEEEEEEEEKEEIDPTACTLNVRLDGKKKVDQFVLHQDDPLSAIIDALSIEGEEDEEIQITCVAKRLVVKSSDETAMKKSLREHRLMPSASVVVKVGSTKNAEASSSSIKERAAEKKNRKKGSHTMQSIGIYAKDDNNKAELIDGGGGVWYEHDVTDDEDESADPAETGEKAEEDETAGDEEEEEGEETNDSDKDEDSE